MKEKGIIILIYRLLHDKEILNNTYEDILDKLNEKEK